MLGLKKDLDGQKFALVDGALFMEHRSHDVFSFVKLAHNQQIMARKVLNEGKLGDVEYKRLDSLIPVEAFNIH